MRERGFGSHALMGAVLLAGVWFALHLPHLSQAVRQSGWPTWVVLAVFALGALGGPILLVILGGDELLGVVGILAALLVGWAGARLAAWMGILLGAVPCNRLCGAALGPLAIFGCFHLIARRNDRKE